MTLRFKMAACQTEGAQPDGDVTTLRFLRNVETAGKNRRSSNLGVFAHTPKVHLAGFFRRKHRIFYLFAGQPGVC